MTDRPRGTGPRASLEMVLSREHREPGAHMSTASCYAKLHDNVPGRSSMKLVLFQQNDAGPQLPGLLTERGVVDISTAVRPNYTPQLVMEGLIDDFDKLRPTLEQMARTATA